MLFRQQARRFSKIIQIRGREMLDSRGFPTVEAEIETNKAVYRAMVPSGASTGIYEALELRDGDKSRFHGKGVLKAVGHVNNILNSGLKGLDVKMQGEIDRMMVRELDGSAETEYGYQKSNLGANSILAVSLALARAASADKGLPLYRYIAELTGRAPGGKFTLPVPSFNVVNGGTHAGNLLPMQEFMIMPVGAESFREGVRMGAEVFHSLKKIIGKRYGQGSTSVGDEGGFAPLGLSSEAEVLDMLQEAMEVNGYLGKFEVALDVAASEFYDLKTGLYDFDFKNETIPVASRKRLTGEQMQDFYVDLVDKYPIITSIEDPFDQDSFKDWTGLTSRIGHKINIVGDDLLVTNPIRMDRACNCGSCNALLLKVNQIGTLTESIEAAQLAYSKGWEVMVSHRSGETEDTFIADLSVGIGAQKIKMGAPSRSERVAKYNDIMRIEEMLGSDGVYFPRR